MHELLISIANKLHTFFSDVPQRSPTRQSHQNVLDLPNLRRKAEDFVALYCSPTQTNYLCRDQSIAYYKDIMSNHNGIMKPVIKDGGGHPENPINNTVSGLFFMVKYSENERSVFGPCRFILPTGQLIQRCHMYFSDFYCLHIGKPHYVQIVLARPYTHADATCRQLRLEKLDPYNNPFIKFSQDGDTVECAMSLARPKNLWIEVFYTEVIDVNEFVKSRQAFVMKVDSHGCSRGGIGRTRPLLCGICETGYR